MTTPETEAAARALTVEDGADPVFWPHYIGKATAALAAAAALRAPVEPVGWREIASAPKDGTPILCCGPRMDHPYVVIWSRGEWMEAGGEQYSTYSPTHWMPLPASPPRGVREP